MKRCLVTVVISILSVTGAMGIVLLLAMLSLAQKDAVIFNDGAKGIVCTQMSGVSIASIGPYTRNLTALSSHISAKGEHSVNLSAGMSSELSATGEKSICIATGEGVCMVRVGKDGVFCLRWTENGRPRLVVGHEGEDGIKADEWYRVNSNGLIVPVNKAVAEGNETEKESTK